MGHGRRPNASLLRCPLGGPSLDPPLVEFANLQVGTWHREAGIIVGHSNLEQSTFSHAEDCLSANDEVIERLAIHQRLLERLREKLIGTTGFGHTRGMVVGEYDRRRVVFEDRLHDLTRIDAGLGERAPKKLLVRDQSILAVEEQTHEYLMLPFRDSQPQVVAHCLRTGKDLAPGLQARVHDGESLRDHGIKRVVDFAPLRATRADR